MKSGYVLYQGRHVPIKGFRAYVYASDDRRKLVSSWDEYQKLVSTGIWHPTKADLRKFMEKLNAEHKKEASTANSNKRKR